MLGMEQRGAASAASSALQGAKLIVKLEKGIYTVTLLQGAIELKQWEFINEKGTKKILAEMPKKLGVKVSKKSPEIVVPLTSKQYQDLMTMMAFVKEISVNPAWAQVESLSALEDSDFSPLHAILSVLNEAGLAGSALDKKISQKASAHDHDLLKEFSLIGQQLSSVKSNVDFFNENSQEKIREAASDIITFIETHYLNDYTGLYSKDNKGCEVDTSNVESSKQTAIKLLSLEFFQSLNQSDQKVSSVIYAYLKSLISLPLARQDGNGVCTHIVNMLNEVADKHSSTVGDYVSDARGDVKIDSVSCEKGIKTRLALLHRNFMAIKETNQRQQRPTMSQDNVLDAAKTFVADEIRGLFRDGLPQGELSASERNDALMIISRAIKNIFDLDARMPSVNFDMHLGQCLQQSILDCMDQGLVLADDKSEARIQKHVADARIVLGEFTLKLMQWIENIKSKGQREKFLSVAISQFPDKKAPSIMQLEGYLEVEARRFLITQMPELLRQMRTKDEVQAKEVEQTESSQSVQEPNSMQQNMFRVFFDQKNDVEATIAYLVTKMPHLKLNDAHIEWFRQQYKDAEKGKQKLIVPVESVQNESLCTTSTITKSYDEGKRKRKFQAYDVNSVEIKGGAASSSVSGMMPAFEALKRSTDILRRSVDDLKSSRENIDLSNSSHVFSLKSSTS